MTIFLHVGVGKTGTTTLQLFLEMHRAALAARGLHVATAPQSRNHRALAMYALDDTVIDNARKAKKLTTPAAIANYRNALLARVRDEAATAGLTEDTSLVFSSEQLTRLKQPSEFARLRDLLSHYGRHKIKIVAYLRRQDQYYASSYSQYIKGGQDIDMVPTASLMKQSVYDLRRFLDGWAQAFGQENIIVRVFERFQLKDGDVISDFLDVVGVRDNADLARPPRQNESLDVNTVRYLRLLNPHVPRFIDGAVNRRRPVLIAALEAISDGPKVSLSSEDANAFLALFAEGNADIARRYLHRADGRLFLEPVAEAKAVQPDLDLAMATAISARLFNHLLKA